MSLLLRVTPFKKKSVLTSIILFVVCLVQSTFAQAEYRAVHEQAVVVDMHCDAMSRHVNGRSIEYLTTRGHVDLARLKQGGVDVQFFALWPNPWKRDKKSMYDQTVEMLDSLWAISKRNPDKMGIARSPGELKATVDGNKLAACIGIEGGTAIEDDLSKLDYFYDRGVRYLSLTWNESTSWASCAKDEIKTGRTAKDGLNELGQKIIRRMNERGMIIDLSHSGEQTFNDVMAISTKPVICSHSAVYDICPHYRNLTDSQLKTLAVNGGVLFINFYPGYLVKDFERVYQEARKQADAIEDSLEANHLETDFDRSAYIHQHIDPIYPGIKELVDHIDYVVNLVGDDHVGIGSDYDGVSLTPAGLNDVSKMPRITKELFRRGYSRASVEKILGGNFLRVFEEVCAAEN